MAAATHYLQIPETMVQSILEGKKKLDARPITGIYAPILVGDHIRYNQDAEIKVNKINTYGSMKELFAEEGWENIAPDATGPEDAYRQVVAGMKPGEEKLPAKAIYFVSMEGHWYKYWFRASGQEQV